MAKKPKKPKDRDLGKEMAMLSVYSRQAAEDSTKAYISGQKELTEYQMGRLPEDFRTITGLQREGAAADRNATIDWLGSHGADAMEALRLSSPDLAARLDQIGALADATGRTPEMTRMLDDDALRGLELGGELSAEDTRNVDQSTREAFASRGLANGRGSAVAEILNRNSASESRKAQRQNFAASREAANRQFTQSATQISDAVNPAMRILGMPTGAAQGLANTVGALQGVRTPDPSGTMANIYSYGSDLYNTNFNAAYSNYNSALNRYYASRYGGMGLGGGGINGGAMALGGLGGAASGALAGAAMGSMVPGVGNAVGAVAGGLIGGLGGMSAGM